MNSFFVQQIYVQDILFSVNEWLNQANAIIFKNILRF